MRPDESLSEYVIATGLPPGRAPFEVEPAGGNLNFVRRVRAAHGLLAGRVNGTALRLLS